MKSTKSVKKLLFEEVEGKLRKIDALIIAVLTLIITILFSYALYVDKTDPYSGVSLTQKLLIKEGALHETESIEITRTQKSGVYRLSRPVELDGVTTTYVKVSSWSGVISMFPIKYFVSAYEGPPPEDFVVRR